MDEQNKGLQYTDSDVAKVTGADVSAETPTPAEDDMFEDLFTQDGQQEATPTPEETPAAETEASNVPEETPAQTEAPMEEGAADEGFNVDDINVEGLSPEVLSILNSIEVSDTASDNALEQVKQLSQWETVDVNQLKQTVANLETTLQDKDRQIVQLLKQVSNERAESERLLDENMLSQTSNREAQKYSDYLADNPLMKDVVVYWMHSGDDDKYKTAYIDSVTKLFEEATWRSIDDMMEERKRNEKMWMGEWAYDTTGVTPSNGNDLGWMLEDIS